LEAPLGAVADAFEGPRVLFSDPDGPDVVGCGAVATVTASGPDRFRSVREQAEALFAGMDAPGPSAARPRLFGGFAFDGDHEPAPPWEGFGAARFVLPRVQAVREGGERWLVVNARGPDDAETVESALADVAERIEATDPVADAGSGTTGVTRTPSREGWRRQVRTALQRIEAGDIEKVVLAQRLSVNLDGPLSLPGALDRLAGAYPDCYRFAVEPGGGGVFFGATPETLVERRGRQVRTEALAGSIGRGGTPEEDARLARALVESQKVQHEHGVVADTVADQLESLAADVEAGERTVRKLGNVQHLRTPISADLGEPTHVLSLVAALHPTPAVGGRPPEAASEIIRETEAFDRGWYAAPVGWFDAAGDGTFAVGIRSAVARGSRAHLFAGNGIVADSDPEEEYRELQLKYRPILDLLR
jgi:menaquinone-specific isochorismate synthase